MIYHKSTLEALIVTSFHIRTYEFDEDIVAYFLQLPQLERGVGMSDDPGEFCRV